MNNNSVSINIRRLRESRHWSQEEAALASGVDVRTIQRAEAGQPLSRESLKALAAAFDTSIESFSVNEEIRKQLEDFQRRYKIISLQSIGSSGQFGDALSGAEAFHIQRLGELKEEQLDQIAQFEEQLKDYLDISSDVGAVHRREMEKELWHELEVLISSGVSVSFGTENISLRNNAVAAFRLSILYVAVAAGPVLLKALARPKNQEIAFA